MENAAGCQRWETVLMNLDSKGSVHSLKPTANAPENEWVSNAGISKIPGGGLIFRGYVSFREGKIDGFKKYYSIFSSTSLPGIIRIEGNYFFFTDFKVSEGSIP